MRFCFENLMKVSFGEGVTLEIVECKQSKFTRLRRQIILMTLLN
jgi:hypothetical protein